MTSYFAGFPSRNQANAVPEGNTGDLQGSSHQNRDGRFAFDTGMSGFGTGWEQNTLIEMSNFCILTCYLIDIRQPVEIWKQK